MARPLRPSRPASARATLLALAIAGLVAGPSGTLPAQDPCEPTFSQLPIQTIASNFGMCLLDDFNQDGHLDLTIGLVFYLGDGAGGFGSAVRFAPAWGAGRPDGFDMKTADYDGDGLLDAVVAGFATGTLTVLWGARSEENPNLFFAPGVALNANSVSTSLWHIDRADFNGDKRQDIVAISIGDNDQAILLNDGERRWTVSSLRTEAGSNHMLAAGDYNGDGNADVAMGRGNQLSLFFGNGDGTFGREQTGTLRAGPRAIQGHRFRSADLDGDGKSDLVATGGTTILIYLGSQLAEGIPSNATLDVPVTGTLRFVEILDLNADGVLDLISLAATSTQSRIQAHLGLSREAPLSYRSGRSTQTGLSGGGSVLTVGDVNEDGAPDLAITTEDSNRARILVNANNCGVITYPWGDVNADERVDLSDAVALLGALFSQVEAPCLGVGDINGDASLNLTDAVYLLSFLFQAGPAPVGPERGPCTPAI